MPDREDLPRPAEDRPPGARRGPGSRTEWIGTSPPIRGRGRLRRPGRRVELRVGVELDDLGVRERRAASAAKRIISTAPSAKFGARKHGTRCSRASRVELLGASSEARRPDHARHAGRERRDRVRRARPSGAVKSTAASKPSASTDLPRPRRRSPRAPRARAAPIRTAPTLPSVPKSRILMRRAHRAGIDPLDRGAEALLARADARRREPLRREQLARRARRSSSAVTASIAPLGLLDRRRSRCR